MSLQCSNHILAMKRINFITFIILASVIFVPVAVILADECLDCHKAVNPSIVKDWQASKHSKNGVSCAVCHGSKHKSSSDSGLAEIPQPQTCAQCHKNKFDQFSKGKHALAWSAMKAMPSVHWQPMAMIEGMKGCGGCHKLGLKSEDNLKELKKSGPGFGMASCDGCHTRHSFSIEEARQPQACQTCHMGFDHPQWEMYSASKHGVRFLLKQNKTIGPNAEAPSCQTCHMQQGDHAVRTAWGFLAVRLPLPEDKDWAADRATIFRALGLIDEHGKTTPRFEAAKAVDIVRLAQEDWQKERDKMIATCRQCHSGNFVKTELEKGDQIIKEADKLMAQAINIVAALYRDNILKKPENYGQPFPDLLAFHDAPSAIEQKLFLMFSEYRMRAFQGAFHSNPDYAFWYGWSAMKQALTEIKEMDMQLRSKEKK
jgi:hydroxylamine dehydrogenase